MNERGSDTDSGSDFDSSSGASSSSDSDSEFDSDSGSKVNEPGLEDEPDQEWGRIPVDVDEHEARDGRSDGAEDETDPTADDDYPGPEPSSAPVKPGDPTLENALFVVLGAIAMGLVLFRLVSLGIGG